MAVLGLGPTPDDFVSRVIVQPYFAGVVQPFASCCSAPSLTEKFPKSAHSLEGMPRPFLADQERMRRAL